MQHIISDESSNSCVCSARVRESSATGRVGLTREPPGAVPVGAVGLPAQLPSPLRNLESQHVLASLLGIEEIRSGSLTCVNTTERHIVCGNGKVKQGLGALTLSLNYHLADLVCQ